MVSTNYAKVNCELHAYMTAYILLDKDYRNGYH